MLTSISRPLTFVLESGDTLDIDSRGARKGETVFSLMRPPGHHATRDRGMGFSSQVANRKDALVHLQANTRANRAGSQPRSFDGGIGQTLSYTPTGSDDVSKRVLSSATAAADRGERRMFFLL